MRQAGTEDDIREVQSVFCASPDVLARDRLSLSKEKSARKCVLVDSSTSQLLSGDNTVTAGRLKGPSAILLELKAQPLKVLITEIVGLEWRWGSTGKVSHGAVQSTLILNSEDLIFIPGSAIYILCGSGHVI